MYCVGGRGLMGLKQSVHEDPRLHTEGKIYKVKNIQIIYKIISISTFSPPFPSLSFSYPPRSFVLSPFLHPSLSPAQYFVIMSYLVAPLHHEEEEEYSTFREEWNSGQRYKGKKEENNLVIWRNVSWFSKRYKYLCVICYFLSNHILERLLCWLSWNKNNYHTNKMSKVSLECGKDWETLHIRIQRK